MRTGARASLQNFRSGTAQREALRIAAAIAHIGRQGNLDGFPARRSERLALVTTAARQGLVAWHGRRGRYELTWRGHKRLRRDAPARSDLRPAARVVNAAIIAAVVLIAAGMSLTARLPADAFRPAPASPARSSATVAPAAPLAKADKLPRPAGNSQGAGTPAADLAAAPPREPAVRATRPADAASIETQIRASAVAAVPPLGSNPVARKMRKVKHKGGSIVPGFAYAPFGTYRFERGVRGLY